MNNVIEFKSKYVAEIKKRTKEVEPFDPETEAKIRAILEDCLNEY